MKSNDFHLFWTTFVTIFLAELGDKTQFAALAASAKTKNTAVVWAAVVLGLGLAGTLGVVFGRILGNFIDPSILTKVAGVMFIAVGVWVLVAD
ncbi:MAG: TMEM165/GDT1 family protein [Bdellovibrionales bacterium]|nr:TMEM165/GDT1 family protein [Bdellovibrionales bacterium]